jgi:hypothetical protein
MVLSQQDSLKLFHAIKTYPLNLANVGEFNIAYETNFDEKNGIEFLIGTSLKDHVFYSNVDLSYWWGNESNIDDVQPSANILTRISYKRYFGKNNFAANKFYISPQFMFKYSFLNNIKYVNNWDGTYEAILDMNRYMVAFHFLIGKQSIMYDSPVMLGWFFGVGAKYSYYNKKILESWHYYDWSDDDHYSNDPRTYHYSVLILPSFYCGINLGMIWNKNK